MALSYNAQTLLFKDSKALCRPRNVSHTARTAESASMENVFVERHSQANIVKKEVSLLSIISFNKITYIVDANGSLSFLMFLFMIGLFIAGIGLLYQRDKFREEIKNYYQGRQS